MAMERWRPISGPMSVGRWDPFRNLGDIQGEMNRLFDAVTGRHPSRADGAPWLPAVEMQETGDELVLTAEVPGVREKDIAVSITGDVLSIKGDRRQDFDEKQQKILVTERAYGQFERLIQLPFAVKAEAIKATYHDGLLEIRLPKAENLRPREIKIDVL